MMRFSYQILKFNVCLFLILFCAAFQVQAQTFVLKGRLMADQEPIVAAAVMLNNKHVSNSNHQGDFFYLTIHYQDHEMGSL